MKAIVLMASTAAAVVLWRALRTKEPVRTVEEILMEEKIHDLQEHFKRLDAAA